MPRSPALRVRPFRTPDREAVRRICCDTALAGGPVEPLFPDRDAFADFFTRYYTDWEPETAFVAEVDGRVVGYLIGCTRHLRYRLVQPALLLLATAPKVLWRLLTGRYGRCGLRFLRWFVFRSWRETPAAPPRAAHFHFNMLPGQRNTGAALRLWLAFDRTLAERGVERVYGQIQTGGGEGWRSEKLFTRWGFRCFDRRRVSKFEGVEPAGASGTDATGSGEPGEGAAPGSSDAAATGAVTGAGSPGPGSGEIYVSTLFREKRPPGGRRAAASGGGPEDRRHGGDPADRRLPRRTGEVA